MIALANEGHNILFSKTDNFQSSLSKEKVVYSTNDFDDAKKWMLKMLEDGYQVSFSFDEETGEYTCIAIKWQKNNLNQTQQFVWQQKQKTHHER